MAVNTKEVVIPSSPDDLKKIKDALQEISYSYVKISSERDLVKDIVAEVAEKYNLPKKYVNKMARVFYKNSFDKESAEMSDFEQLYVAVAESK